MKNIPLLLIALSISLPAWATVTALTQEQDVIYRAAVDARLTARHRPIPAGYRLEWVRNVGSRGATSIEYMQSNFGRIFNRGRPEIHIRPLRMVYERDGRSCTRAIRLEVLDENADLADNIQKVNLGFERCRRIRAGQQAQTGEGQTPATDGAATNAGPATTTVTEEADIEDGEPEGEEGEEQTPPVEAPATQEPAAPPVQAPATQEPAAPPVQNPPPVQAPVETPPPAEQTPAPVPAPKTAGPVPSHTSAGNK